MEPANAVNNVMQGKVEDGILSLFRLMINSTVGVAGIFDVAQEVGIERKEEDVGRNIGCMGYIQRSFLSYSELSDRLLCVTVLHLSLKFSWSLTNTYIGNPATKWSWWGGKYVSARERLLPVTDMLDDAIDPYVAMRNAYLQSRQSAIQDGDEPAVIPASSMLDPFAEGR